MTQEESEPVLDAQTPTCVDPEETMNENGVCELGTPGFELVALVGALGVALVLARRKNLI